MFNLMRYFLKQEMRNYYYSKWYVFTEVFALFISLIFYWLTSQALSPHLASDLGWYNLDYFSYVILGETCLMLPLQAFSSGSRVVRGLIIDRQIETFICIPGGLAEIIKKMMWIHVGRDGLYAFSMLLAAKIFFNMSLDSLQFIYLAIFVLVFLPGFLGLGYVMASIVVYFGRGEGVTSQVTGLLSLLSGVYFPITVFQDYFVASILPYIPFTYYLTAVREFLAMETQSFPLPVLLYALVFSLSTWVIGLQILKISILQLRKKGVHRFAFH